MPPLTELSTAKLRNAGDAIETLIEFRDYLPPGETMLMQAGKSRGDIRALLGMPPAERVSRGPECKTLDNIEDAGLDRLFEAAVLLTGYMDKPELRMGLRELLGAVVFEKQGASPRGRGQGVVNRRQAAALQSLLEVGQPDAATTVTAQPDGVHVTICGRTGDPGVSGPGGRMQVEMRLGDNSPFLKHFLEVRAARAERERAFRVAD